MTIRDFLARMIDAAVRETDAQSEEQRKPSEADLAYMQDLRRRIAERENAAFENAIVDEYGYVILRND